VAENIEELDMERLTERELAADELGLIWGIDRAEEIGGRYTVQGNDLVYHPDPRSLGGWPPGIPERYTPILEACHARGGWFHGLFDGERLVGVAVLDSRPLGGCGDQRQLKFLYVDRAYRNGALGKRLFEAATAQARRWGARRMYVSATPSENAVRFYQRRGCYLNPAPDPELLALEPRDIHMLCDVAPRDGS
jgi:GNAT superfamily N-acetyltransferase